MNHRKPTIILGGQGKTDARVAARLAARGEAVRIGSRTGVPPFDGGDRSTWGAALGGARDAYIADQPHLAIPGSRTLDEQVIRVLGVRSPEPPAMPLLLLRRAL